MFKIRNFQIKRIVNVPKNYPKKPQRTRPAETRHIENRTSSKAKNEPKNLKNLAGRFQNHPKPRIKPKKL
jgi:hypothetical protein